MRSNSTAAVLGSSRGETLGALLTIGKYHAAAKPLDEFTREGWVNATQRYQGVDSPGGGKWHAFVVSAGQTSPSSPLLTDDHVPTDLRAFLEQPPPPGENERFTRIDRFLNDHSKWWKLDGNPSGANNVFKEGNPDASAHKDSEGDVNEDGEAARHDPSSSTVGPSQSSGNALSSAQQGGQRKGKGPARGVDDGGGGGAPDGEDDLLKAIADAGKAEADAARAHRSSSSTKRSRAASSQAGSTSSRRVERAPSASPAPFPAVEHGGGSGGDGGGGGGGDDSDGDGGGAGGPHGGRPTAKRRKGDGAREEEGGVERSVSPAESLTLDGFRGTKPSVEDKDEFLSNLGGYLDEQDGASDPYLLKTLSIARTALSYGRSALEKLFKATPLRMPVDVAYGVVVNEPWDLPKVNGFVGRSSTTSEATLKEGEDGRLKLESATSSKTKALSTPFEWEQAFSTCEQLAGRVYPHRKDEFRRYREHLRRLMADEPEVFELWVAYDLEFRTTLGQPGRNSRLDDVVQETYLKHRLVYGAPSYSDLKRGTRSASKSSGTSGKASSGGGGSGKKGAKKAKDAAGAKCNNWNGRAGACREDGPSEWADHPASLDDLTPADLISARLVTQSTLTDALLDDVDTALNEPLPLPGLSESPRLTRFLSHPVDDPPLSRSLAALADIHFPTSPPDHVLSNPTTVDLLKSRPDLFDLELRQPYDLDTLEKLLTTGPTRYPHQGLVRDFLHNMRHGWWPMHDGDFSGVESASYPMSKEDERFVEEKGQQGFEEGWMGPAFKELLPGMTSSPTFIRRPVGGKARWIIDHSRSDLNSGIDPNDVRPRYDMLDDLVRLMRHLLTLPRDDRLGALKLILWRADIKNAYWGLPMHPFWQPRQALPFKDEDGEMYYRIDFRMEFGSRASPYLWSVAQSFILWLAQESTSIEYPMAFVDDSFGADASGKIVAKIIGETKYFLPLQLAELIDLFQRIQAPFDILKQISSLDAATGDLLDFLKVLGILVTVDEDPRKCTVAVPNDQKRRFALLSNDLRRSKKVSLGTWRTWLGRAQFVGLVVPWAKWVLNRLYAFVAKAEKDLGVGSTKKIRVKDDQEQVVDWYLQQVLEAPPMSIFDSTLLRWPISEADVVVWSDSCGASTSGGGRLGFVLSIKTWADGHDLGYYYRHDKPFKDNNFAEAVALLEAFRTAVSLAPNAKRFLLFTDSSTSIYAIDAGRGTDKMLEIAYKFYQLGQGSSVDYRVRHVSGKNNSRADGLSRLPIAQLKSEWGQHLRQFQPSDDVAGGLPLLSLKRLHQLRDRLQHHHIKPSTRRGYHSSRKNWYKFARLHGFGSIPTSESLQLYAAFLISQGHSSLKQPFSALRDKFKHLPSWSVARNDLDVKEVLIGARKLYAKEVKRAKPIKPEDVRKVIELVIKARSGHDGLLIAFIVGIAFCGLLRLGEAVAPQRKEDFDPRNFAKRTSFSMDDKTISFSLPYSRSDTLYEGSQVVIVRELVPKEIPLFAIACAFIKSRDAWCGKDGLLFARRNGSLVSRNVVITALRTAAGEFSGHSFRSGGATFLAELGLPDLDIQRAGRWKGKTYQLYVRQHPSVLAATRRNALQAALHRL
ncbi:hypothetical protein JCM6882_008614 [Rhodosporidiobolus microsporus]